jgi:hypothetical protein
MRLHGAEAAFVMPSELRTALSIADAFRGNGEIDMPARALGCAAP